MPAVLVTGASRGIGKSIVERLCARGWDVIAGVGNQQDAEAVTRLNPQRVVAVILDVTSAEDIAALDGSPGFKKMIPVSQKIAVPAEKVAAVVEQALTGRRPRPLCRRSGQQSAGSSGDAPSHRGPGPPAASGVPPALA